MSDAVNTLDARIAEWRSFASGRPELSANDVDELEGHLRDQVDTLSGLGLSGDEAFLVAVKRMGALDTVSREFAREHAERLWKHLVFPSADADAPPAHREGWVVLGIAIAAAALLKIVALIEGRGVSTDIPSAVKNFGVFALCFLTGYLVWKRGLSLRLATWLMPPFVVAAAIIHLSPWSPGAMTLVLALIHIPIALWLVVGVAYAGGAWSLGERRMDFIRFTGELVIYYALIALGGGVLMGFTTMMFQAIGVWSVALARDWIIPSGMIGAVIVGAWLVEAKQSVIENMAPVLTRIFTPLFALLLVAFLGTAIVLLTRRTLDIDRDMLIGFDLLLVVVLGLTLYAISARDRRSAQTPFDGLQLVLVLGALAADLLALTAIGSRISEFGFSPNRVAALGENLLLLVNLSWTAILYVRFLRGRVPFAVIERWQTNYLPVFAGWAALVALAFPPIFRWI